MNEKILGRKQVLDMAEQVICIDREKEYGSPDDNFQLVANLWSIYLNTDVSKVDVTIMMTLLKLARINTGEKN